MNKEMLVENCTTRDGRFKPRPQRMAVIYAAACPKCKAYRGMPCFGGKFGTRRKAVHRERIICAKAQR